jgi:hypothetical protein
MSDTPIVMIVVQAGIAHYVARGDVKVVLVDWYELTEPSRGELCRAYKALWDLPESMRAGPLGDLIGEIQRVFPIMATFCPERFQTADRVVPDGRPVRFDVTEKLLLRGPVYIDNLRDRDFPTDDLADDLPARQEHDGPFRVEVKDDAMEFLFADESEGNEETK